MDKNKLHALPRLYIDTPLDNAGDTVLLPAPQAHYLRNVLRKNTGDPVRLFNGRNGEWLAEITVLGKKDGVATLSERLTPQPEQTRRKHLLFAPIKKQRLDILIEKAVELGTTDLHPVITQRTENRKLNEDRLLAQVIEAAEQSERLSLPVLHPAKNLPDTLRNWTETPCIYACIERDENTASLANMDKSGDVAFLIGPEGGFTPEETALLRQNSNIRSVSLGKTIYRAETACIICLSQVLDFA